MNFIRGVLIGAAEVVPGVSGGTLALIVGVYRALIDAAADAVMAVRRLLGLAPGGASFAAFAQGIKHLPWRLLIPLGIGMVAALVAGAKILEPLLETQPIQMRALFFGLVIAGAYVPAHMVTKTSGGRWRVSDLLVALVAAAVLFVVTGLPPANITDPNPLVVFFAAAIAICALVLPGVSGSFLLLSIGLYETTINAVNERNFGYLLIFAAGAVLGLAVFVSLLKWLLEHKARVTLVIITGLMIGSLRALWPWQTDNRDLLAPTESVLSALLLFVAGVALVAVLLVIERRFGASEEQADAEILDR